MFSCLEELRRLRQILSSYDVVVADTRFLAEALGDAIKDHLPDALEDAIGDTLYDLVEVRAFQEYFSLPVSYERLVGEWSDTRGYLLSEEFMAKLDGAGRCWKAMLRPTAGIPGWEIPD